MFPHPHVTACFLVGLSAALGGAPPDTQPADSCSAARECYLKGNYQEAVRLYEALGRHGGDEAVRAACGRTDVDLQTGDYAEGIARLRKEEAAGKGAADWHACLAALLAEIGQYDEAIKENRQALAIETAHFRARCQLGELLEILGRDREAIEAYEPFETLMTDGPLPDRPEDLVYLGRGFYRVSVLKQHPNLVQRTRHVLTEVYQEAFDVIDPLFWPGRLAGAELLLDKHNLPEAGSDFEKICEQNPKVPAAHVGLGRIALGEWDFDKVEQQAQLALETNPRDLPALLLLADLRMEERRHKDAEAVARRALEVNPNSIEALAVLAAAQFWMGDTDASQTAQQRILQINPRPAVMHYVLAVWLDADRRFPEARQHLAKAIEYAPTWPAPRVELGRLYMETGGDSLARTTLDEAFKLDTFDANTHSILGLLDTLEKFARLETEHFVIKYDEQADGIIAPYFAEVLEAMYPVVCRDFGAGPDKRTIIEVFPDHMGFSIRTSGRPFIATIGACTGRVITLSAPRRTGSVFGRFDWGDVLRHEFTHTVTMAVTDNRISHWFTEGLAVHEERPGQSWQLKHTLSDVVRDDRLFTIEKIDWGFVRPREPGDRSLAYAQSEWMVEYIIERSGELAIVDMLASLREGKTQEQTFKAVLKCGTTEFDREFKKWAAEQVAKWNLPMPAREDSDDIETKLADAPDDPALLARLAAAQMFDGDFGDAENSARRALEIDEKNKLALEVLGHVLMGRMLGEPDEGKRQELTDKAEPFLRQLIEVDAENPSAIKYLGYVEQSRGNWPAAVQWLTRYQKMFPDDPDSYRRLAGIYFEEEDTDQAKKQLELLYPLAPNDSSVPRRIADIYRDREQPAEAATWLRRALEDDLYDADLHRMLGECLLSVNRPIEAEREFQSVCRLTPNDAAGYAGLAKVYEATGDAEKAAQYRLKADQAARSGRPPSPGAEP